MKWIVSIGVAGVIAAQSFIIYTGIIEIGELSRAALLVQAPAPTPVAYTVTEDDKMRAAVANRLPYKAPKKPKQVAAK